jgi:transcriptional regulator with XRE-family HTH domain
VNFTALARDVGVSFRYLLAVLTGQRNCTLNLLQRTAHALGITLIELLTRMEKAYHLRLEAAENKLDKTELRQLRSKRRALSTRTQGSRTWTQNKNKR